MLLDRVPDALILPASVKVSHARLVDRVAAISDVADPLLGVVRGSGVRSWIRQLQHGRLFVTRDSADSLMFARDHPRSGQSRYRWEAAGDGVELGWLVEGASSEG